MTVPCPTCDGQKLIEGPPRRNLAGGLVPVLVTCPVCHGDGFVSPATAFHANPQPRTVEAR